MSKLAKEMLGLASGIFQMGWTVLILWAVPEVFGFEPLAMHWGTALALALVAAIIAALALLIRFRPLKRFVDYLSATRGT